MRCVPCSIEAIFLSCIIIAIVQVRRGSSEGISRAPTLEERHPVDPGTLHTPLLAASRMPAPRSLARVWAQPEGFFLSQDCNLLSRNRYIQLAIVIYMCIYIYRYIHTPFYRDILG